MYGPYLTGMIQLPLADPKTDKPIPRWYTCFPCDVLWKAIDKRSHCFVCGKWGSKGLLIS